MGGSLFGPSTTKYLKKYEDYAVHAIDPVGSIFRSDEENRVFTDPINIFGLQNPEMETGTPVTPKTSTTDTTIDDIEAQSRAAADAEANRIRRRKGYKSTVLTTMSGDLSAPSTLKKTLGGV
jgi:hypothetical protein